MFQGDNEKPIEGHMVHIPVKPDSIPIFRKAYDVPFHLREAVKKEIIKLQSQGVLVPVEFSEWATPLVVVRKNNDIRLCLDLKQTLNKVTEKVIYPLPKIEDIMNTIRGAKCFTILDLRQAYLQLKVHPQSQQFLGVSTPWGIFRQTRLAFGLSCAAQVFQRFIDEVIAGLEGVICYLDDVLIYAEDKSSCYDRVTQVLDRFERINIKVRLEKCKFF